MPHRAKGMGSFHPFADCLEEAIDLLRREDERHGNLFFEWWDIEERILLKDPPPNEETKEAPCECEDMVYGTGFHHEIAPHVEEEGRMKGVPIGLCLAYIAIKETEVISAGA